MVLLDGFNADDHDDSGGDFEPLPQGQYTVVITSSELKENKAGTGSFINLTLQVIDGPHANRLLWHCLNVQHPNPKAVAIANGQLSAICKAVGVLQPKDTAELHNIPLAVKVICKAKQDGTMGNDIKGYLKLGAPAPAAVATSAPSGSAQPWSR